jgi:hypothetical protein
MAFVPGSESPSKNAQQLVKKLGTCRPDKFMQAVMKNGREL